MLDQESKRKITSLMWGILVPIVVTAMIFSPAYAPFVSPLWFILVPVALVALVTLAFWVPAVFPWIDAERLRAMQSDQQYDLREDVRSQKRKRDELQADDRLDLLLSLMTPEERDDFLYDLKRRVLEQSQVGEDGEIEYSGRSLASLFEDEPSRLRDER